MRVTGEETSASMSRSFLMKKANYSHCPLKKRPIHYFSEENYHEKDSSDNSEPENLSTKPEDLSVTCKSLTPTPAVALITAKKSSHQILSSSQSNNHPFLPDVGQHFLTKNSGGPLEPLNLNTSHYDSSQNSWPRAVPAQYPSHYVPLSYIYPSPAPEELYHHYYSTSPSRMPPEQLSPYAPRESSQSPPHHAFTPFRPHVPVIASLPHCQPMESRLYVPQPMEHSPLSPSSSSSSNSYPFAHSTSPPPISPEDLSSPGSTSSNNGDYVKKKNKDNGTPRYKCAYCSKSYSTYSGLSKHQQFHCSANEDSSAKKTFSCKYCEKIYTSLGALKMHIRTHTLPCKCKLCGKAFSRPWLLQGHIRTHTGEKPFSCPHCNRAFADRSNLRAHLQTHSDVKKYSCISCSKTFSRMSLLSKHAEGGCPGVNPSVIRSNENIHRPQPYYHSA